MSEQDQQAVQSGQIEELRGKIERGEELTPAEQELLRDEGVDLPGDGTAPPAV